MGRNSFSRLMTGISFFALLLGSFALDTGSAIAVETDTGVEVETGDSVPSETPKTAAETENTNRITRKGLTIEFVMKPVLGSFEAERDLLERDFANAVFHITDAATGQPVTGLIPGAWMDIRKTARGETTEALSCKDRVGLYLRGSTGARPMVDLNSYFILVLNEDSTITVVDPSVLIAGVGDMFFTQIILNRPGADWVQTRDQKRLFVSMPRANAVAVVDTETFRLTGHIKTGKEPFRVALQGDEKYLWVGNNAKGRDGGGVTVVDLETLKVVATIETGKGHHEIAFSDDDRYALVTNRNDGTASLIDIQSLEKIEDIEIGAMPISVSYSKLSKAFYVADGKTGIVAVVDAATRQVTARIAAKAGLGPMSITADGRWVLVTNSVADRGHVIDTAPNVFAQYVAIPGKPFKISLTRAFA